MDILFFVGATIIAYLIGSIPTSVWIGRVFYKKDVREFGSGNAGATNTFRVLGKKAGIPVLIIDLLKGWLAVKLIFFLNYQPDTSAYINVSLLFGILAVVGHIFPIYVGFKGGKGVATLVGVMLAVHAPSALVTMGIFVIILLITRYVSLSSLISAIIFPFLIIVIFKIKFISLIIFSIAIAVLLVVTHQKNIKRLLHREETKINLFKRKKNDNNNAVSV